jgi:GNAT superfamily N-acetyltransferase
VRIERYVTARGFIDAAGAYLVDREAEHNLILGVTGDLAAEAARGTPMSRSIYLATATHGGRVVGAAMMTPPHNVALSGIDPTDGSDPGADLVADVIEAFVDDLGAFDPDTPGVLAPVPIAAPFADTWCGRHGRLPHRRLQERIYRAERITPPADVPGSVRVATEADRDLLVAWAAGFIVDAFGEPDDAAATAMVGRALDRGQRTFYLWEFDGQPVSLAAVGGPTPNGIRVGPVYTPPEDRRRGYASAVTAAASQAALDAGRRFVFLFTDLANPISNRIYQSIGFAPVIDVDQIMFDRPDVAG